MMAMSFKNYQITKSSNYQINIQWQRKETAYRSFWSALSKKTLVCLVPAVISPEKNKKNNPERLELKKFNANLKKVTVHKEIK
jgi:hypothetical protein